MSPGSSSRARRRRWRCRSRRRPTCRARSNGGRTWSAPRALATARRGTTVRRWSRGRAPERRCAARLPADRPRQRGRVRGRRGVRGRGDRLRRALRPTLGARGPRRAVAARYRRGPVRDPEGEDFKASADNFSLAVDPRGVAYLAAHDESDSPNSRIIVRRSRDGGKSWKSLTNADQGSRGTRLQGTAHHRRRARTPWASSTSTSATSQPGDGKAQYSWWFAHSDNRGRSWQRATPHADLPTSTARPTPPSATSSATTSASRQLGRTSSPRSPSPVHSPAEARRTSSSPASARRGRNPAVAHGDASTPVGPGAGVLALDRP